MEFKERRIHKVAMRKARKKIEKMRSLRKGLRKVKRRL